MGDLDGDGRADLVIETATEAQLVVEAVSGADGHRIWRRSPASLNDWLFVPGADVNRDGVGDFQVLTLSGVSTSSGTCNESRCQRGWRWDFTWTHGVVSGATGATLWSTSSPGWFEYSVVDTSHEGLVRRSWSSKATTKGENVYLGVDLGRGPSSPGVVVNRINLDRTRTDDGRQTARVLYQEEGSTSLTSMTEAEIRDGATGELRRTMRAEGTHVSSLAWAGQLVGDGEEDLLWQARGVEPTSYSCRTVAVLMVQRERCADSRDAPVNYVRLTGIDGATLAQAWETRHDGQLWSWAGQDLTGDGVTDVRLVSFEDSSTTLISGADGTTAWTRAGYLIDRLGDLGGGPGPDAILVRFGGTWDEGFSMDLVRIDGTTGTELVSSHHELDTHGANMTELWVENVGPVGGSTGGDVTVTTGRANVDWDAQTVRDEHTDILAEDGATASVLSERHLNQFGAVSGVGDVTGDGRSDATSWHYESVWTESDGWSYFQTRWVEDAVVELLTMTDLRPLPVDRWLSSSADLDGDGVHELIFARELDTPDGLATEITAVNGPDGSPRWTWIYSA